MTAINPSYYHYVSIIQLLGKMASDMSKRRVKCDDKGYLYYDSQVGGKIYVGRDDMVNRDLFTIERDTLTVNKEVEQDLKSLWGTSNKPRCAFCNGFGVWPNDRVPLLNEEVEWALSDDCGECGSNNHLEYMEANGGCGLTPPWENKNESIGFHAALERFKRSASCVESSDTQVVKTAQE